MLSCKEVEARGGVYLAGELRAYQKFRVYLHLAICRYCRLYLRELDLLLRSFKHLYKPASKGQVNDVINAVRRNMGEQR